jgi:GH25 family lysozyme M1 (1,4-beta-N-acetylmuramidase)
VGIFVDVASWEGVIDWPRAYEAGVREAYIRFGVGAEGGPSDPEFIRNCHGASMLMKPDFRWSAYHVPILTHPSGPRYQARLFGETLNILRQWTDLGFSLDMPPCGDWERYGNALQATNRKFATAYQAELADIIGIMPGIYTGAGWWNSNMGVSRQGFEREAFLWLAQPGYGGTPTTRPPDIPTAFKSAGRTWDLHQYSWKGLVPGIQGEVDLNRRNPLVVILPPPPYVVLVTAYALNVRSGPGTTYPIVGSLKTGALVTVQEESGGWGGLSGGWIFLDYTERV